MAGRDGAFFHGRRYWKDNPEAVGSFSVEPLAGIVGTLATLICSKTVDLASCHKVG